MTDRQAYSYTVLRYVHDVVAGEALNVGVVMHAKSENFLKARTRKTVGRLRHVFPDLDRQEFVASMRAVDRGLAAIARRTKAQPLLTGEVDARGYALRLLPDDDSTLQWSPTATGLTTDWPRRSTASTSYVVQYDQKADRTDDDVWRPVAEKLTEREVHVPFEPKMVAGAQDRIEFKKAWKNGCCMHTNQCRSTSPTPITSRTRRRWRGHLSAVWEGKSEDVEVHFVLGLPRNTSLLAAYKTAKQILEGARFTTEVVDESDVDVLVATLEDEYRAHQGQGYSADASEVGAVSRPPRAGHDS